MEEIPVVLETPSAWINADVDGEQELWRGVATVRLPNGHSTGDARVLRRWLPEPALRVQITTQEETPDARPAEPLGVELDGGTADDPEVLAVTRRGPEVSRTFEVTGATLGDGSQDVDQVRIALVNFPDSSAAPFVEGRPSGRDG